VGKQGDEDDENDNDNDGDDGDDGDDDEEVSTHYYYYYYYYNSTIRLLAYMRVQTKGFDENYTLPHIKYTQLIFAATVPFSTLDTHAFTPRFFYAFFTCTRFSYMPTCVGYHTESSRIFCTV
jgi:hypothetical protein